jgi:hypothetical protein
MPVGTPIGEESVPEAYRIWKTAKDSLNKLAQMGYAFFDVKLENMLMVNGRVMLSDVGGLWLPGKTWVGETYCFPNHPGGFEIPDNQQVAVSTMFALTPWALLAMALELLGVRPRNLSWVDSESVELNELKSFDSSIKQVQSQIETLNRQTPGQKPLLAEMLSLPDFRQTGQTHLIKVLTTSLSRMLSRTPWRGRVDNLIGSFAANALLREASQFRELYEIDSNAGTTLIALWSVMYPNWRPNF